METNRPIGAMRLAERRGYCTEIGRVCLGLEAPRRTQSVQVVTMSIRIGAAPAV